MLSGCHVRVPRLGKCNVIRIDPAVAALCFAVRWAGARTCWEASYASELIRALTRHDGPECCWWCIHTCAMSYEAIGPPTFHEPCTCIRGERQAQGGNSGAYTFALREKGGLLEALPSCLW